jgi:putative flavoprotein involved in K+ transport
MRTERFETVVIGAGQAGLSAGYHLKRAGRSFVILDGEQRIGDNWRRRYDSLRLFTPAYAASLDGFPFPSRSGLAPTRDEFADYLEAYATRLDLPVRLGVRVEGLTRDGDIYVVTTDGERFEAANVIVASGAHRDPMVPAFARDLDPAIVQLHSSAYRNPSQFRDGAVLVVGAGNSGADISLDAVGAGHPTWLSGPERGHVPADIDGWVARTIVFRMIRFFGVHVATLRNPIGRRAIAKAGSHGDMLVRVKPKQLAAAGITRVGKTVAARGGQPFLEDGTVLEGIANVIWCIGFRHDLSWIDLAIFGEDGRPMHERGVVTAEPGLYFVGLPFQFALGSDVIPGVSRDARWVVKQLLRRSKQVATTDAMTVAA